MKPSELQSVLQQVQTGTISIDLAVQQLSRLSVSELEYATVDLDRKSRCGFPEVILAEGKTPEWVVGVVARLREAGQDAFATRVNPIQFELLRQHYPLGECHDLARTFWYPISPEPRPKFGNLVVVTAGTGDLPVAHEAVVTAEVMNVQTQLISDVGVAGIHRVLRHREVLQNADVVIVVAGMDGALPSVVGGLVDAPVFAVPTSIGYGAAFGGVAPLLTMLNSCSAGVAVVNIDAGFKAGYVAARMIHKMRGFR
jgi:NCAIR mutase (PurE)-related protein